jgi:hypothetical protein
MPEGIETCIRLGSLPVIPVETGRGIAHVIVTIAGCAGSGLGRDTTCDDFNLCYPRDRRISRVHRSDKGHRLPSRGKSCSGRLGRHRRQIELRRRKGPSPSKRSFRNISIATEMFCLRRASVSFIAGE